MADRCLYADGEKCITKNDFIDALKSVGVANDDILFVHADIGVFGKLADGGDRATLCQSLISALKSAGSSTLVMPTFTYAFCKNGIFDPRHSPSEVGVLTEYFRLEDGIIRSKHPIFSVAAAGPEAEHLTSVDMDSFGDRSFFATLHQTNGLIVFFGASFERATFAHHIEQMHGVPYRFVKTFKGILRDNGIEKEVSSTYLVRYLDQDVETYLGRLESELRVSGVLKEASVGAGKILSVRAQDMFLIGMKMLDRDIYAFLKNPPKSYTA